MSAARVPQIREVAIADSFAFVGGYPAWYLGRVLRGFPDGLEALLVRSGIRLSAATTSCERSAPSSTSARPGGSSKREVPVPEQPLTKRPTRTHPRRVGFSFPHTKTTSPLRLPVRPRRFSARLRWPCAREVEPGEIEAWERRLGIDSITR